MATARTTIRLDEGLLRAAKIQAAARGTSVTKLVEIGLRRELGLDAREPSPEPVELPVSEAAGSLAPGFDSSWSLGKVLGYLDESKRDDV